MRKGSETRPKIQEYLRLQGLNDSPSPAVCIGQQLVRTQGPRNCQELDQSKKLQKRRKHDQCMDIHVQRKH